MQEVKIKWTQTRKQREAWEILNDKNTTELLFGGGAGGAKSYLGCAWLILNCINYPGTTWVMGRKVLKRLKETTLATFFRICSEWGIKPDVHYVYRLQEGLIEFKNGSVILLKDLMTYPTDPEFEALGSLEITGAFVDEASEVSEKAINILNSRRRLLLDKYGLIPKTLMTCNPTKKWLYSEFYKPNKEGKLKPYRKFIQALVGDNPFISKHYIENLQKLDEISRQRLLFGNWEFDDDPAKLLEYDDIMDLFTNTPEPSAEKYISCDVARFGSDRTVIVVWEGYVAKKWQTMAKSSVTDVVTQLEQLCVTEGVRRSNVIVDEDGVGGGVVDMLDGCKGFVNNSAPIQPDQEEKRVNYGNLKTQCAFEFVRLAKAGKVRIEGLTVEDREMFIQECEQLKQKDIETEGKIYLVPKDQIKENIGRSPDLLDAVCMRFYFEVEPQAYFFCGTF